MASGGVRPNSGRPKMTPEMKELFGNPSKQKVETVDFSEIEELPRKPADWLSPKAQEIYLSTWKWLKKANCLRGILPRQLEEYSHLKAQWNECESQIKGVGMIIKEDGKVKPNPYMQFAQNFLKQSNEIWAQIYIVVRDTKSMQWSGSYSPEDETMEKLLGGK